MGGCLWHHNQTPGIKEKQRRWTSGAPVTRVASSPRSTTKKAKSSAVRTIVPRARSVSTKGGSSMWGRVSSCPRQ